jgi:6-pyruvoyltetrahydropterin/6-carboxytetrahydropterin synthase
MFCLEFNCRFAMAHWLISGVSEKCSIPHGHNEIVTATLVSVLTPRLDGSTNMVEPFERAKSIWHSWIDDHIDHSLHLSSDDPLLGWFAEAEPQRLKRILDSVDKAFRGFPRRGEV